MGLFSSSECYGVIGVGSFGHAVAHTLASSGKNVIAIDSSEAMLKELGSEVSSVYQVGEITKEVLEEAGIGNCHTVIIGIGENLEASIMATLHCIELGVNRVISKAKNPEHGRILEKLGAEVVYPEENAGTSLAKSIMSKANLDTLPLCDDFSIISVDVNPAFVGHTVIDLNWRKKYNINIVAIIKDGKATATVLPDTLIEEGDRVVLSGSNTSLERFKSVNAKGLE